MVLPGIETTVRLERLGPVNVGRWFYFVLRPYPQKKRIQIHPGPSWA
jgi:hypothetical protein